MTLIRQHTIGTSATAEELQLSDIPREELHRLYLASLSLSVLIGSARVAPSEQDDKDADDEMECFRKLLDEIWRKHAMPTQVDEDLVRAHLDRLRAADQQRALHDAESAHLIAASSSNGVSGGIATPDPNLDLDGMPSFDLSPDTLARPEVAAAVAEANRLLDLHGDDDPSALAAVACAVNLAQPGLMDRALADCGINLPEATHVNDGGLRMFSIDQIAQALQVDPADVAETAASMANELGQPLLASGGNRIQ